MKRANPLFVGIGSTKIFLLSVAILALLPQRQDGEWSWRIWSFLISPSNEIGDTLAGIAGALAFLWIIVTVMLQSKELAAQREEIRLGRLETKKSADALEAQVELLKEERKHQRELYSEKQLNDYLGFIRKYLEENIDHNWSHEYSMVKRKVTLFSFLPKRMQRRDFMPFSHYGFFLALEKVAKAMSEPGKRASLPFNFSQLARYARSAELEMRNLSPAQLQRAKDIGALKVTGAIDLLLDSSTREK